MFLPFYCKYKVNLGHKDEGEHLYWELKPRTSVLAVALKAGFGGRGKAI